MTSPDATFTPDWASPPGATIAAILEERGITPEELARRMGRTAREMDGLLSGSRALIPDDAVRLANSLGGSEAFWNRRESQYREDLDRLLGRRP